MRLRKRLILIIWVILLLLRVIVTWLPTKEYIILSTIMYITLLHPHVMLCKVNAMINTKKY